MTVKEKVEDALRRANEGGWGEELAHKTIDGLTIDLMDCDCDLESEDYDAVRAAVAEIREGPR